MSNIVSILKQINDKSLLLIDEIGSGTDPQEGSSLAIAILDYIASKQSLWIASTHYPELKAYGMTVLKRLMQVWNLMGIPFNQPINSY